MTRDKPATACRAICSPGHRWSSLLAEWLILRLHKVYLAAFTRSGGLPVLRARLHAMHSTQGRLEPVAWIMFTHSVSCFAESSWSSNQNLNLKATTKLKILAKFQLFLLLPAVPSPAGSTQPVPGKCQSVATAATQTGDFSHQQSRVAWIAPES